MPRKKSPYLLSKAEIETLAPVVPIIDQIITKYSEYNTNDGKESAVDALQNRDFITACTKNGIDTKKILAIHRKVSRSKWFSYYTQGGAVPFAFFTSDNPQLVKPITQEEYPKFYELSLIQVFDDQTETIRSALNIPEEYKFLSTIHFEILYSIDENFIPTGPKYGSTGGYTIDKMMIPLDKVSRKITALTPDMMGTEQKVAVERENDKQQINTIIMLDMMMDIIKKLGLEERITGYDLLVCLFVDALTKAGNRAVSYGQIYRAMYKGNQGGADDYKKIDDALTKCGMTRFKIDNLQEHNAYHHYSHFEYDAPFLPFERVKEYKNGKLAEACIALYREFPLLSYAQVHNQVSTVSISLFQAPISKTEYNIKINMALVSRLLALKNGKRMNVKKMLYSTIADDAAITNRKARQRVKPATIKYMDYFKQQGFILDYEPSDDGRGIDVAITTAEAKAMQDTRKRKQEAQNSVKKT